MICMENSLLFAYCGRSYYDGSETTFEIMPILTYRAGKMGAFQMSHADTRPISRPPSTTSLLTLYSIKAEHIPHFESPLLPALRPDLLCIPSVERNTDGMEVGESTIGWVEKRTLLWIVCNLLQTD